VRNLGGAGTQNAGLAFGGNYPAITCTEEYNGAAWSTGGALINPFTSLGGAGTQNSAIAFGGGQSGPPYNSACTELYNGTSWTASGALIVARQTPRGAGAIGTLALAIGGRTTCTNTEEFGSQSICTCSL
jgi:hypothetical protein